MKKAQNISNRRPRTGWLGGNKEVRRGLAPPSPNALFKSAKQRVGETSIKNLRWLLAFAQGDRNAIRRNLEKGISSILAYEIACIAHAADVADTFVLHIANSPDQVIAAADEIQGAFLDLVRTNSCRIKIPNGLSCTILRGAERDGLRRRVESFYEAPSPTDALFLLAKSALEAEGLRLKACAARDCQRLFLKQKRGTFCSSQCSKKETLRRWRENNPDKVRAIAKRAYKKRVLPRNTKIDIQVAVGRTPLERERERRRKSPKVK